MDNRNHIRFKHSFRCNKVVDVIRRGTGGTAMTKELFCKAITKFICGVILIGLLLFLPAGTLDFPRDGCLWLFYLYLCSLQVLC